MKPVTPATTTFLLFTGVIPVMVETRLALWGCMSIVLDRRLFFCFSFNPYNFILTLVGNALILGCEEPVRLDIESMERVIWFGCLC